MKIFTILVMLICLTGCATKYKATPYWEYKWNVYPDEYGYPPIPDYYVIEPMK